LLLDPRLLLRERAQPATTRLAGLLNRPIQSREHTFDNTSSEPGQVCRLCTEMQLERHTGGAAAAAMKTSARYASE
ncbi:MAG: hypothetical protein QOE10_1931, partial [Gaiellales bacterium]|nr:hypothetical protein [Gaiellales bacterium]